jgi:hypothetical protein
MLCLRRIGQESAKLPAATGTRGTMRGRDASGVARRATPESDAPTLAELRGRADRGSRLRKLGALTRETEAAMRPYCHS